MSRLISRIMNLETISVEVFAEYDGEGAPSYSSPIEIQAHAKATDAFVTNPAGSTDQTGEKVSAPLTLWVPPDAEVIPGEQDRITRGSEVFIGIELTSPRRLKSSTASFDHYRLRCRRA